jgi:hypothetical protein
MTRVGAGVVVVVVGVVVVAVGVVTVEGELGVLLLHPTATQIHTPTPNRLSIRTPSELDLPSLVETSDLRSKSRPSCDEMESHDHLRPA